MAQNETQVHRWNVGKTCLGTWRIEREGNICAVRILKEVAENVGKGRDSAGDFLIERPLFPDSGVPVNLKKDICVCICLYTHLYIKCT